MSSITATHFYNFNWVLKTKCRTFILTSLNLYVLFIKNEIFLFFIHPVSLNPVFYPSCIPEIEWSSTLLHCIIFSNNCYLLVHVHKTIGYFTYNTSIINICDTHYYKEFLDTMSQLFILFSLLQSILFFHETRKVTEII